MIPDKLCKEKTSRPVLFPFLSSNPGILKSKQNQLFSNKEGLSGPVSRVLCPEQIGRRPSI